GSPAARGPPATRARGGAAARARRSSGVRLQLSCRIQGAAGRPRITAARRAWSLLPQQGANVVSAECAAEGLPAVGHGAQQLRLALVEREHLLVERVLAHPPVH